MCMQAREHAVMFPGKHTHTQHAHNCGYLISCVRAVRKYMHACQGGWATYLRVHQHEGQLGGELPAQGAQEKFHFDRIRHDDAERVPLVR